jgi:serine/threonine-protein kinase
VTTTATSPIGTVAQYTLLERLEPEGPGDLYRARDTRLGRTVAVRIMPPEFLPDRKARLALIDRAKALVALSHHNVTALFDVGEHQERVYLAFEYLVGQSLRAEMAGRHMQVRRALEVAIQIADAVADAHAAGFVHGGLSPDTIVITAKGHAKIPAFELASRGGFELENGVLRLSDYGSPEEAAGEGADERSDVFSIGSILYEMLATRKPVHRGSAPPSVANSRVPAHVDAVVLRAVAPNPGARMQTAVELASELRAALAALDATDPGGDDDEVEAVIVQESPPRSRGTGVVGAITLLALAALAWWWLTR